MERKQGHLEHAVSCVMSSLLQPSGGPRLVFGMVSVMTMAYLSHYPAPTCQREAADDPASLTDTEMEIITNVSCGMGHKLIHTKYCTLGVSCLFFPVSFSSSNVPDK